MALTPQAVKDALPAIGEDFPETTRAVWCPHCGMDGHWFRDGQRPLHLEAKSVPLRARCINDRCRVETFSTKPEDGP